MHVVHGAFQTGHNAVNWNVNSTLGAFCRILKDSPARRADYCSVTGSTLFPLKFCSTRWVENASVAQRALEIYPYMVQYAKTAKLTKIVTSAALKKAISDPLMVAKTAFFQSVANVLEPFFKQFQATSPTVPFLYQELEKLLRKLMQKFIKQSALQEANTTKKLMRLDLGENKRNYKEVDIGVAAMSALTKSKVSELAKIKFITDCIKYLSAAVSKLRERSPLKYKLARASTCFAPLIILYKAQLGKIKMKDLTQLLHDTGHLKSDCVDHASLQYSDLCDMAQSSLNKQLKNFDLSKDRLDEFYTSHLAEKKELVDLFEVIKFVLVLSHRNAVVESGFSINSDVLVENLKEESVVAQRQVFDGIHAVIRRYQRGSNYSIHDVIWVIIPFEIQ